MLRFILIALLVGASIIAAVYAGFWSGFIVLPSSTWTIVTFLTSSSIVIFRLLFNKGKNQAFTLYYLLSIVSKICFFGIFMVVIIYSDRDGAAGNVVLFMITYVTLTALEVGFLFKKINGSSTSQKIK